MRLPRAVALLPIVLLFSGCGYVHFGKMEKVPSTGGDTALVAAYSNLATEHKILKQELALARKEGDTLRSALERGSAGASGDARLSETSAELAALRASYAKLQAERASGTGAGVDPARLRDLEDKLAASLRNYTQLQEENSRLRSELERTRQDNATLSDQLKVSVARYDESRQTAELLNIELLAQKQARSRAEQATEAVRAQLNVVLTQGAGGATGTLSGARESTANSTAALQLSRPPTSEATPTAELRTDAERVRRAGEAPASPRPTVHIVQAGETLEKIAIRYYGSNEKWTAIYGANQEQLGGGQPLRVGMELKLP